MCHSALETICDKLLSSFALNFKLRRYTTEGRVEVEVAALRKLYSRQTALERDLDTLRTEVRDALSLVEDDLVSAAVAQALNTECDAVSGEVAQVGALPIVYRCSP